MLQLTRCLFASLIVLTMLAVSVPVQAASKSGPDLVMVYKSSGLYVRNQGRIATGSRFNVALYLSELPTPSQVVKVRPLAAGEELRVLTISPTLPITAICPKAIADSTNAVDEANELNNTLFFGGIGYCG